MFPLMCLLPIATITATTSKILYLLIVVTQVIIKETLWIKTSPNSQLILLVKLAHTVLIISLHIQPLILQHLCLAQSMLWYLLWMVSWQLNSMKNHLLTFQAILTTNNNNNKFLITVVKEVILLKLILINVIILAVKPTAKKIINNRMHHIIKIITICKVNLTDTLIMEILSHNNRISETNLHLSRENKIILCKEVATMASRFSKYHNHKEIIHSSMGKTAVMVSRNK